MAAHRAPEQHRKRLWRKCCTCGCPDWPCSEVNAPASPAPADRVPLGQPPAPNQPMWPSVNRAVGRYPVPEAEPERRMTPGQQTAYGSYRRWDP